MKAILFDSTKRAAALLAAAGLLLPVAGTLRAQSLAVIDDYELMAIHSGLHSNPSPEVVIAFTREIQVSSLADFLRVHFSEFNLGRASYVTVTSEYDQHVHQLDARLMAQWNQTSAIMNRHRATLRLHVAPGDEGVFVRVDKIIKPCLCGQDDQLIFQAATLCGGDNRVASTDNRVGRISGCTAWLISNGAVLSAGHCAAGGSISGVFEINVPLSDPNGSLNASAPGDQFPIVSSSLVQFDNLNVGGEWSIFSLNRDNQGRRAHDRVGFFRITDQTPGAGINVRVTGCGNDTTPAGTTGGANAQENTLQTATGPNRGRVTSGADIIETYSVDTEPGSSGSPVIWVATGFAFAIHTDGGCNSDGTGANNGTSLSRGNLRTAIADFPGVNTFYVDTVTYPNSPVDNGGVFSPDHNLASAFNRAPSGGKISIVEGTYPRTTAGNTGIFGTGNKAMLLVAPVGSVVIGQ